MSNQPPTPGRWYREPLLHFALLAALLFLIDNLVTQRQKSQIVVSQQTAEFLIKQREDLELRTLSPEERRETIDAYIEDELLYREAYVRGLDRGDSRMRRNLILKMRGLLGGEVDEPSGEALKQYYEDNQERFVQAETWSVQQVFFSPGSEVPKNLVEQLNNGLDPVSVGMENFNAPRILGAASRSRLSSYFSPDVARQIILLEDNEWHGPFESPLGIHFVRLRAYTPQQTLSFEKIESYLSGEWLLEQTRKRIEQEAATLKDDYEIIVSPDYQ